MEPSKAPPIFLKPYDPAAQEPHILDLWEKSGYANPDNLPNATKGPYSIVLPPPNVTGTLHMGHAAMLAVEDILIRYHRMRGYKTLWLPGTDHAAIATQSVVEKELEKKEGLTRHKLGREKFLERAQAFAKKSHDTIVQQIKKMGASVDWSREAFTLDDKRSRAVRSAFQRMHEVGLIYHGEYLVNWDPKGQTTVSDDEIEYEETMGTLYTFRYSDTFPVPIATTRPETKLGDVAVAVHPNGKWKRYIGQKFIIENFAGVKLNIEIVGDEVVDPEFGTGAVGITPAHSKEDWDIAQRHNLPLKQVINEYGKMIHTQEEWNEKISIKEAREKIVEWLKNENLLEKEEQIKHNVAKAQRSGGTIEILPKRHQFFVNVNKPIAERENKTLKELMREPVREGRIKILPERFEKIYFHWIDNLRDWNISRQVWYGHPIPAWYKGDEIKVAEKSPGKGWLPIEDTFDTWFSSGLWTFSTLGWPDETKDLKTYHPTSVLETGYDILFFWVARMILMSGFLMGEVPFKNVYLHGLVRDAKGRKMSKSLGNVIDPLDMVNKYGADAARLSLIIGAAVGNDIKLSEDRVRGYKHFANKLWNITRFVLENQDRSASPRLTLQSKVSVETSLAAGDQKLIEEARETARSVSEHIDKFRLDLAADTVYHYVWDRFAAEILEESKSILKGADAAARGSRATALYEILLISLKLLHPFMPFVTEAIWQNLPRKESDLLMVAMWPT